MRLGGERQHALLALLLLRANEVVPSERILEELFRDAARDPANALQVAISRLRRGPADGVLETRPRGYLLHAEPDELDSAHFERLADEGRRQLAAGDAEVAAATLGSALKLWRGPPLQELALLEFAQPEIRRLEELRLTARMDRIDAELALGRADELIPELEALTAASRARSAHRRAGEVDAQNQKLVSYDGRELSYDLLVAVPMHGGAAFVGRLPGAGLASAKAC